MAQPQANDYKIAAALFGGRRAASFPNEDVPCHVGVAIYSSSAQPATCHLHHIRAPVGYRYQYDPRPTQPFNAPCGLWASCVLRSGLSSEEAAAANADLKAFGDDERNLPEWAHGNCQDWMAGAIAALEAQGLVATGDGAFWTHAVGLGRDEMERQWKESGREVFEAEGREDAFEGDIHARWGQEDGEERQVGKLGENARFHSTIGVVDALLSGRLAKKP